MAIALCLKQSLSDYAQITGAPFAIVGPHGRRIVPRSARVAVSLKYFAGIAQAVRNNNA
jgi:hypothetical protein